MAGRVSETGRGWKEDAKLRSVHAAASGRGWSVVRDVSVLRMPLAWDKDRAEHTLPRVGRRWAADNQEQEAVLGTSLVAHDDSTRMLRAS